MTLRQRLAVQYGLVVAVCLTLLAGLSHHEFVVEPRIRQQFNLPKASVAPWREYAEVAFHILIPLVLGGGWWLMRRSLRPLAALTGNVERIHAENLCTPLPRNGNGDEVDRLTVAFNAVTARLHESFQQIRTFTLQASHELKTPLAVMRAQLDTALRGCPARTGRECGWIRGQLAEVERLARIVDALTFLTKADAGLVRLEKRPVNLTDLVRESYEDALLLAEAAGLRVELQVCDAATVLGDRDRLRQLLLNLVDNALKYNRPGGELCLALRSAGDAAEFRITNTGEGIAPELLPRVFDRFVRGNHGADENMPGSGVGLTICQWIVHGHGGTIRIGSEPGRLTTVTVLLPLATQ